VTCEEAMLQRWLEARGWRRGFDDLWRHEEIAPAARLTAPEAMRRQTRRELERATTARNRDIARAEVGADAAWRREALATVRRVAEEHAELTTDTVLEANPALENAREPRALGPVLLRAAAAGWIVSTEGYARSTRSKSNARTKRVWRSLVHGGAAPQPRRTEGLEILEALP